jgi:putative toxin-antitoxin system antitoxin component (TIGR02293 family)
MKAYSSTLKLVGARRAQGRALAAPDLIEIDSKTVPFGAVETLTQKLGIDSRELLNTIGIAPRTALRRKREGYLKPDEADRLLRVARLVEEATRIFGSEEKASRWLNTPHPLLGNAAPRALLDSDAGAQQVRDELIRIEYGEFA